MELSLISRWTRRCDNGIMYLDNRREPVSLLVNDGLRRSYDMAPPHRERYFRGWRCGKPIL